MSETGTPNTSLCQHHWLIESPDGPVSMGVCRLCGAEREFQNYTEFPSFGGVYIERSARGSRLSSDIESIWRNAEDLAHK